tara:strand:+ start:528 stop:803 length:276 start_codon:yes stop_codon:yes gene_type:complete
MNLEDITVENIKHYIEGNANHLLDKVGLLPEQVKAKVEKRLEVCNTCSYAEKIEDKLSKCGYCGCPLPHAAFSPSKSCKHGGDIWQPIIKE